MNYKRIVMYQTKKLYVWIIVAIFTVMFVGSSYYLQGKDSVILTSIKEVAEPNPTPFDEPEVSEYPPLREGAEPSALFGTGPSKGSILAVIEESQLQCGEATLPSGNILFIITNKTHWGIRLYLKRSNEELTREIQIQPMPNTWTGVINLSSGSYELIGADQSQYKCEFVVN